MGKYPLRTLSPKVFLGDIPKHWVQTLFIGSLKHRRQALESGQGLYSALLANGSVTLYNFLYLAQTQFHEFYDEVNQS